MRKLYKGSSIVRLDVFSQNDCLCFLKYFSMKFLFKIITIFKYPFELSILVLMCYHISITFTIRRRRRFLVCVYILISINISTGTINRQKPIISYIIATMKICICVMERQRGVRMMAIGRRRKVGRVRRFGRLRNFWLASKGGGGYSVLLVECVQARGPPPPPASHRRLIPTRAPAVYVVLQVGQ